MKLTSKGRYAVTAVLDIALNADGGPVSLADISERQHISLSYLEQLFAKLRKDGLVKSVRGPGGGYQLGLPSEQISVGMIIAAVNENIHVTKCLGRENCKNGVECLTHELWEDLSLRIESFLNEITLAELVNKRNVKRQSHRDFSNLLVNQ
ncbi:Fe-S cluster assembly transcriptional regulator IscR [Haemophilus influenzae]|jgi:iron-sulfur cluster assembly transcription factor IscR|uniref:Fe-S cluster assembly transcriptional regulator IscR n=5 Tax=Haemophilus influenzae TaxID=727 RepID=A0A0H3PES0_HAEI3|nr:MULTISPECIES: Fe-S cluster assembly transcriptional regulator IscR [Haemophilus]EDJ90107.1 predicted transcriptional regulator [Haemophilus influenzae R3021]EDK14779.1 predicted transcriptional regulator [Haemophilus influenzae 22.4-21]AAX87434.1 predicted transcriptional regulator [Haemophilus influenzae 86-028NP]ADO95663.1 transcriptional regulator IscR [Haemophilus influenzae R2846]AIB45094.1 Iron-sulfur cluster regulator IscR [Haemophilus influenzae CGSHiCZ412602]